MGSKSDMDAMDAAAKELEKLGIGHEVRVMSAHRDPDVVADYAKNAKMRGLRVIIAGAGLSAALPGVVAAHTQLPVIGVPLTSSKSVAGGLDALLSIAQMPPGVPVACVGVDNAAQRGRPRRADPRRLSRAARRRPASSGRASRRPRTARRASAAWRCGCWRRGRRSAARRPPPRSA